MPYHTPARLVQITHDDAPAWGFYDPCTATDVKEAVQHIAAQLKGKDHAIHIMTGSHGYCGASAGKPATVEEWFAKEDNVIKEAVSADGHTIPVHKHLFNTGGMSSVDHVTEALSRLNETRRVISGLPGRHSFLLAYCCSAGTPPGA